MINDVISSVCSDPGLNALLYADDLVVWASSSNIHALESCLNDALSKLEIWCDSNQMQVNPVKSQFQLFSLSTKQHAVRLTYNGVDIPRTEEAVYLGIKLDSKLSWSKHIGKQVEQASSRMNLLKRLAGTRWGANQEVLSTAYKAYVRPAMEYGSELTITASESSLKKLDVTQNQALRLITGGPKSTPIAAMEMQANIEPLQIRRESLALALYERVKRMGILYWDSYTPATGRLKTQTNFTTEAECLARRNDLAQEIREPFPRLTQQVIANGISWSLNLTEPVSKNNTPLDELKQIALKTIDERYPAIEWLHVYTDGSAVDARMNGGAGVFSKYFAMATPVGRLATNFSGEVKAVQLALEVLGNREDSKVAIFIDSQAAISAIASPTVCESLAVLQCRSLLNEIVSRGTKIALQWIPSHCGLYGNDEADRLAKEGSAMAQQDTPLAFTDFKRLVKTKMKSRVQQDHDAKAVGKQWAVLCEPKGLVPSHLPRDQFVACFRLTTGHDYLGKHLHRIGVAEHPRCQLCEGADDMTALHLEICPALADVHSKLSDKDTFTKKSLLYWAARRRMAEVASVPA